MGDGDNVKQAGAVEDNEQEVLVSLLLKLEPDTWAITELKKLDMYDERVTDAFTKCIEMPGLGNSSLGAKALPDLPQAGKVAALRDWVHSDVRAVIIHSDNPTQLNLGTSGFVGLRGATGEHVVIAGEPTCPTDTKQCIALLAHSLGPITVADLRARTWPADQAVANVFA